METVEDAFRAIDTCSKRVGVMIIGTPTTKYSHVQVLLDRMHWAECLQEEDKTELEELSEQCSLKELIPYRDLLPRPEVWKSKPKVPKPPKVLYQTRKGKWINPVNSYKSNRRR